MKDEMERRPDESRTKEPHQYQTELAFMYRETISVVWTQIQQDIEKDMAGAA